MTNALLLLRLEHNHFNELLDLIEQQLDIDDQVDLDLLQSIVEYFAGYPDQCHHPVEDLIFRKLHLQDPNRATPVKGILQDHKSIAELTIQLDEMVSAAIHGEDGRTTELKNTMRQFVDKYRAHMAAEEESFFKLAIDHLDKNDWAEIEYDLFDQGKPLFDHEAEEQFRKLRDRIDTLATRSYRRAAVVREANILSKQTSIQEFNEMMGQAGYDYRLVEHPEGAYGIEYRGEIILDIPRCKVTRAIWCAYYFVKGLSGIELPGLGAT